MSQGTGRVLAAGLASRLDDGKQFLKVVTDAPGVENSFYLDQHTEAPPSGGVVSWDHGHVIWHKADGTTMCVPRRGYLFDDRKQ